MFRTKESVIKSREDSNYHNFFKNVFSLRSSEQVAEKYAVEPKEIARQDAIVFGVSVMEALSNENNHGLASRWMLALGEAGEGKYRKLSGLINDVSKEIEGRYSDQVKILRVSKDVPPSNYPLLRVIDGLANLSRLIK